MALDPRINPHREGVEAVPAPLQVCGGALPLYARPDENTAWVSELRFGEVFFVYQQKDGWFWGQNASDSYVGYARATGFAAQGPAPTHRIAALSAPMRRAPDIKSSPQDVLPFFSTVCVTAEEGDFSRLSGGGYVHTQHLMPATEKKPDVVFTAGRFLGVPYVWGGRCAFGLDCSGLVQLALEAAGRSCPRDTDMQEQALGQPITEPLEKLQRGDLVFSKGHVMIISAPGQVVHANAYHGQVVAEPLADVLARGLAITSVRRLG